MSETQSLDGGFVSRGLLRVLRSLNIGGKFSSPGWQTCQLT